MNVFDQYFSISVNAEAAISGAGCIKHLTIRFNSKIRVSDWLIITFALTMVNYSDCVLLNPAPGVPSLITDIRSYFLLHKYNN